MASFSVSYSQVENPTIPGAIRFNGVTMPASGRLDNTGDSVIAEGFVFENWNITIECTRTSDTTMRVRVLLEDTSDGGVYEDNGYMCYFGDGVIERVIDDVPLQF